jgi:lipopolysaccharide/colanic/teichoic acid biosynthesis glycosyltransferase
MNALDLSLHQRSAPSAPHGFARRTIDLVVAGAAAVMFAPLMLAIAVALLLEGGRPILFVQTRVGAGAQPFRMFKFRKFDVRCGPDGLALTVVGDCRLTTIGRFLAATKFDELPQLWNVLIGDMAIIGPRPESLAFADCFCGDLEAVLQYRPGLLGPTQVLFPAKARIDLSYYPKRTIGSDIVWIWRGFLAVLGRVPPRKRILKPKGQA